MSNCKTRPIGEIFRYYDMKLQVVENLSCDGCYFSKYKGCYFSLNDTGYCSIYERDDRRSIIFKRIDK